MRYPLNRNRNSNTNKCTEIFIMSHIIRTLSVRIVLLSFNYFPFASHLSDFPYSECVLISSLLRVFFSAVVLAIFPINLCLFNLMRYASFFILHLKAFFFSIRRRSFLSISIWERAMWGRMWIGIPSHLFFHFILFGILELCFCDEIRDACTPCDILCIFNFPYCHSARHEKLNGRKNRSSQSFLFIFSNHYQLKLCHGIRLYELCLSCTFSTATCIHGN